VWNELGTLYEEQGLFQTAAFAFRRVRVCVRHIARQTSRKDEGHRRGWAPNVRYTGWRSCARCAGGRSRFISSRACLMLVVQGADIVRAAGCDPAQGWGDVALGELTLLQRRGNAQPESFTTLRDALEVCIL